MSLPSTLKRVVDPLNTKPFCSLTLVIKLRTVSIDGIRMKAWEENQNIYFLLLTASSEALYTVWCKQCKAAGPKGAYHLCLRNNIDVFISILKPIWSEQFGNVLLCVETILVLRQSGYEHVLLMELEKLEELSKERERRIIKLNINLTYLLIIWWQKLRETFYLRV